MILSQRCGFCIAAKLFTVFDKPANSQPICHLEHLYTVPYIDGEILRIEVYCHDLEIYEWMEGVWQSSGSW